MMFRRPKLTLSSASASFDLLQEALAQYHVNLEPNMLGSAVGLIGMDDIDFVEALELVENAVGIKINKRCLGSSTTFGDVVAMIDQARS
jgi:acyl carrier protein